MYFPARKCETFHSTLVKHLVHCKSDNGEIVDTSFSAPKCNGRYRYFAGKVLEKSIRYFTDER